MIDPRPPDDLVDAFRQTEPEAEHRSDCPGDERLWAAACGSLPREATESVVAHTASCPACSADWRLAAAIAQEAGQTVEREAEPAASRLVRSPWILLAAAVVGTVALVPWLTQEPVTPVEYRDHENASTFTAPDCDGATLDRKAFRLRWSPLPGAVSYTVEVTSADLRLLQAAAGLTATELVVPEETLAGVPAGGSVVWRVTASMAAGPPVTSPAFVTHVAGDP